MNQVAEKKDLKFCEMFFFCAEVELTVTYNPDGTYSMEVHVLSVVKMSNGKG